MDIPQPERDAAADRTTCFVMAVVLAAAAFGAERIGTPTLGAAAAALAGVLLLAGVALAVRPLIAARRERRRSAAAAAAPPVGAATAPRELRREEGVQPGSATNQVA